MRGLQTFVVSMFKLPGKENLRKKQARQAAAAAKLAGANSPALLPKVPEKGAFFGVTSVAVDPKDAPKQS